MGKTKYTEPKQYLSITEAAEFLGVSRPTIYARLYSGELPYNQVEYQCKSYALSAFAAEFMPNDLRTPSGAYQGPKFFSYNGESLVSLREMRESEDANN